MMGGALILYGMPRPAVLVHQKQIDPFRVDAAIGVCVLKKRGNLSCKIAMIRHTRHLLLELADFYETVQRGEPS